MNIEEWKSQIKRGTLEYCILLLINKKACYGYEIMNEISRWPIITARESTIYPLLRRLLKEEYLSSFWQESTEGLPPRKYYSITEKGEIYLNSMSIEWNHLIEAVESMKNESE